MTHTVEIYSPLTGAAYYRTSAMSEHKAAEVAAAYNEGLSEERKRHTAARAALKPDQPQGKSWQVEREETRAGNRSWWD